MEFIDLRSDTVTKPSLAMRRAMFDAAVGDDVLGDDPTVNELQEYVADLCQKEAGLFVPSGTMANLTAILAHTQPGDEVIVEKESHTFNYEVAGPATLAGVQLNPVLGNHGILTVDQIEKDVRPVDDVHVPNTTLICLENTHNRGGGTLYPLEEIKKINELARKLHLKMHLDGARLFNACVATGLKPVDYAQYFDSLMFCFSKGLGAPVGSILIGSKAFIEAAHRYRKMLGGGMRQVGLLAAAARYALENNVERLAEDHANARFFAEAMANVSVFDIDPMTTQTNIVIFDVTRSGKTANEMVAMLEKEAVYMIPFGKFLVRAVTHLDVSREQVERAVQKIHRLFN